MNLQKENLMFYHLLAVSTKQAADLNYSLQNDTAALRQQHVQHICTRILLLPVC